MNSLEKLKLAASLRETADGLEEGACPDDLEEEVFNYLVESGILKNFKWNVSGYLRGEWGTEMARIEDPVICALMRYKERATNGTFRISQRHGMVIHFSYYHDASHWNLQCGSKENLREAMQFYGLQLDWTEAVDFYQRIQDGAGRDCARVEGTYTEAAKKLNDLNAFISDLEST